MVDCLSTTATLLEDTRSHTVNLIRSGFLILLLCLGQAAMAQDKPNIVLVFMDNFGWGEPGFNGGGIIRGAPTPRLDTLASEGLRLTNFNVEVQCTPSRSAIMTGRYAIRSGNGTVPMGEGAYGLVQWEVTMAEMLSEAGYATGMYGKWHLGYKPPYLPANHGFDDFMGLNAANDEFPAALFDRDSMITEDVGLEQGYLTEIFAKRAIDFIGQDRENPFFYFLSFILFY